MLVKSRVNDTTPVGWVTQLGEFERFSHRRRSDGAPIGSPGGVRGASVGAYVASGRCRNRQMSSRVVRSWADAALSKLSASSKSTLLAIART